MRELGQLSDPDLGRGGAGWGWGGGGAGRVPDAGWHGWLAGGLGKPEMSSH